MKYLFIILIFCSCTTTKPVAPVKPLTVKLDGSKSYDIDGYISAYNWRQVLGAGNKIVNPKAVITTTVLSKKGTYFFELTVTDNQGATGKDTATINY